MSESVQKLSETYQAKDRKFFDLIEEGDLKTPETLKHLAVRIRQSDRKRKALIISQLLKVYANKTGTSLIFCNKKEEVNELSSKLRQYKVENEPLHSEIPQLEREIAYKHFNSGRLKCIVATNVAARGLDFPEIDVIIQAEPPTKV